MANNIDIKFSGLVELRAAKYLYTGIDGNDCFRATLTNFYNSSYSYNATLIQSTNWFTPANAFDRSTGTFANTNSSSTRSFTFLQHRVRPQALVLDIRSNAAAPNNVTVTFNGFNEGAQFTTTLPVQPIPGSGDAFSRLVFDNLHINYGDLRRGWIDRVNITSSNGVQVEQVWLYGEIVEENQTKLPPTTGATTIEAFSDSFVSVDPNAEGSLVKEGSLRLEKRRAHTIIRLTLTATYNIPDDSQFNVWNIDPNGANRVVNLPRAPQFNHYLRINNLDGAFQVRINDSDHSTLIQNLSDADGPNTLEAVWANNQWIITV